MAPCSMETRACNTRCQMLGRRSGPHAHRQPIGQPRRLITCTGSIPRCNAAALGSSGSIDDPHAHEQHSHKQQQRTTPLAPPPSRQQLVRPAYAVATEAPAKSDAAAAATSAQNGTRPALFNSLQQAGTVATPEHPSRSRVIDIDEENASGNTESGISISNISIKAASTTAELKAVADLRAEAYYAADNSRFAQSFKRQFAAQEVESLRQRTTPSSSSGRAQLCECLVAVSPGSSSSGSGSSKSVLGCIDIRLPHTITGMRCIGVPEDDQDGCYLLNVVVSSDHRNQGIGRHLMKAAMARAVHQWGAQRLYTHVEADNDVASGLYKGCGFREHSSESKYANTSSLGRLVLLMATAVDAPLIEDTLWMSEQ